MRPELARACVLAVEPPGECDRRDHDDSVQRQQEVRLRRPDMHRDPRGHTREHGRSEQPGHTKHDPGADSRLRQAEHGGTRQDAVVAVRREVDRQHPAADRPRDEPADTKLAPRCDEQQREAERAERPARLGHVRAHATTTAVLAECGPAGDVQPVDARLLRRTEVERAAGLLAVCAVQSPLHRRIIGRDTKREARARLHDDAIAG